MKKRSVSLVLGLAVLAGLTAGCGGNGPRPTGAVPVVRAVKHIRNHNKQAESPATGQKVQDEPAAVD